ncbi:MAG: AbrB/MazE/SpoVT family DNA-binding domain-containing protein [Microcoleaceae cyanobacterium]
MGTAIRTRIVKIGNSQGIRLPKALLQQSGIRGEVEIEIQEDCIVIRAISHPREGWEQAFGTMAEQQDDVLLDEITPTEWDAQEWEW